MLKILVGFFLLQIGVSRYILLLCGDMHIPCQRHDFMD